mmetsp:Transcript_3426/g.4084  ORF Transcript_3426/g.4084 Transcript_3426/m.4084 type:complete len:268 (+) Transcript_3426:219-1022(+)
MDPALALEAEELKKEKLEKGSIRANVVRKMGRKKSSAPKDLKMKTVRKTSSGLRKASSARIANQEKEKAKMREERMKQRQEKKEARIKQREVKNEERHKRREERQDKKKKALVEKNQAIKKAERDIQAARSLAEDKKAKVQMLRQQSSKQVIQKKHSIAEERKIQGQLRKDKAELERQKKKEQRELDKLEREEMDIVERERVRENAKEDAKKLVAYIPSADKSIDAIDVIENATGANEAYNGIERSEAIAQKMLDLKEAEASDILDI